VIREDKTGDQILVAPFPMLMALWPRFLLAQSADDKAVVKVGDMWIYDRKDEVTGLPMVTFTSLVTEVSVKEIVTNAIPRGRPGNAFVVFDHSWNRTVDNDLRYNPYDPHGIQLPLAVGKEWHVEYTTQNLKTGANTKASSVSKIVAQETITTAAGTFETFKIDRNVREFNTADPSRLWSTQVLMWFSPQINHWVRRTTIFKAENRVRASSTDELIDLMRKP
jgi:hypothetical protein